jgi:hypothetical protein
MRETEIGRDDYRSEERVCTPRSWDQRWYKSSWTCTLVPHSGSHPLSPSSIPVTGSLSGSAFVPAYLSINMFAKTSLLASVLLALTVAPAVSAHAIMVAINDNPADAGMGARNDVPRDGTRRNPFQVKPIYTSKR